MAVLTLASYCDAIILEYTGSLDRIDANHQDISGATNSLEGPSATPLMKWTYVAVSYSPPHKALVVDDFASYGSKTEVTGSEGPFKCTTGALTVAATGLHSEDYVQVRHIRLLTEALTQGEISNLRNRKLGILNLASFLRAGYDLEEGLGTTATDIMGVLTTDLSATSGITWYTDDFAVPAVCDEA